MKAFVFPGQGAQFVGMGKDLYENSPLAKELFVRKLSLGKRIIRESERNLRIPHYGYHVQRNGRRLASD